MIDVASTERHHSNKRTINIKPHRLCQMWNNHLFRCAFTKHDKSSEVEFRIGSHSFSNKL